MVPTERPSFSALVQSLGKFLETVADYVELNMTLQAPEEDEAPVAQCEEVEPPSASGSGGTLSIIVLLSLTHVYSVAPLCCAAGAEVTVEPNPVYGLGSEGSEAISTQPNPVHGLSESGTSHEVDPPTTAPATTAPATTAPATDEYDVVISSPIAD